ncbi:MAG: 2-phospho-L-lactate guanylyltransferase [Haloferacaceae archaeon]
MRVLIPFAADRPKTRLDPILSPDEREAFAAAMLADVLRAVRLAGREPVVLSTAPLEGEDGSPEGAGTSGFAPTALSEELAVDLGEELASAQVVVDERPLTAAVNAALRDRKWDDGAMGVVMSDLPLVTPRVLSRFFAADGDLVVAPGRGGGTNALVVRDSRFRVDYHGTSYLDHLRVADRLGATVREFDSHRLSTDVDEPADFQEVLSLSDGVARAWLREAGFELDASGGRVGVRRG